MPSHSSTLYKIDGWGAPYFSVNSSDNVIVRPYSAKTMVHQEIDLLKVVKKASGSKSNGGLDLQLPLIIRFPDVLNDHLEYLQSAFNYAIKSQGYSSYYQGVYPMKCNQDRFIVKDIVKFGSSFRFGLEARSKPELLLSMSCLCKGSSESLLICNSFKDAEYISLASIARKLSLNTVMEELNYVIDISIKLGVRLVGEVRARLRRKHSGHFGSTSSKNGKFSLTMMQIIHVVKKLEQCGMLDCLQLLHFHIGSHSMTLLANGVGEASQIYSKLVHLGASMKVIDIGGGLGIDYDGSKSTDSDVSVGYTLEEYAMAVVQAVMFVCDRKSMKHPVICSKSGRAIVSHHSIIIFEEVSSGKYTVPTMSSFDIQRFIERLPEDAHSDYHNLSQSAVRGNYEACLAYADLLKQSCVKKFKHGSLDIEQLAVVDGLCVLVEKAIGASNPVSTYHLLIFGHRTIVSHHSNPSPRQTPSKKKRILSDLTYDSDGKIDKFIGEESNFPLHELEGENGM
ncbi:Arginine decarboxylase [Cynara cardunculus var. scolymus]|uniref:Arginine decarboxylase n=1 Tax=Cynara cardunculus var. scolymus TaxID=59895 RepID=A0A103XB62_CYNCS|nr:Arginine decarboxylase [Cynara cardunculus var. scolymus]